ncbi:hypothetical protein [Curtobacterium sp. MCBD17_013]|uniref:hypothetical protein n=1 Tax=Curtobacterium sp. MCBD17_013 TaxID=2175668 RepID=UPI0011B48697|nr:hypothetical protein [Curtobacterium sp. MCBD17_013]
MPEQTPTDQDESVLAIREGRHGGPPVDHHRALVRSVLWFLAAAAAVLVVGLAVERPFDPRTFAAAGMAGSVAGVLACAFAARGKPGGYVPTVTPEQRVRDRRVRRAIRRDDPRELSEEEYSEALRRAPYISARAAVQSGQVGWYALALVVQSSNLHTQHGPLVPAPVLVLLAIAALVTGAIGLVGLRRSFAFARRPVPPT